jgi:hypothetical protein
MSQETNVKHLIINRLSNEQYETAVKSDTQLYLTPEEPASTTNLGPVKVDGTTIIALSDGTIKALDSLPSQSGNAGKFLTTNGTTVSWASVDAFPSQTGNTGKFLTTDGTNVSWATVDALPAQSGQSGKYLTTNGTAASWSTITFPTVDQTYSGTSTNAQSGVAVKSAIDAAVSSVYKPAGSVTFANLPTLSASVLGNVYDVADAFTTTSDFVEGAGKSYPANTNVVVVNTGTSSTPVYKFDTLAGMIDLSGYLPLTGGTLTGDLYIEGSNGKLFGFKRTVNNTNIDIGWDYETNAGSGVAFRSNDSTDSYKGCFIFFAKNSSGTVTRLIGTPTGSLTWGNNKVITVANKSSASDFGVVKVDGTTITSNNGVISAVADPNPQYDSTTLTLSLF